MSFTISAAKAQLAARTQAAARRRYRETLSGDDEQDRQSARDRRHAFAAALEIEEATAAAAAAVAPEVAAPAAAAAEASARRRERLHLALERKRQLAVILAAAGGSHAAEAFNLKPEPEVLPAEVPRTNLSTGAIAGSQVQSWVRVVGNHGNHGIKTHGDFLSHAKLRLCLAKLCAPEHSVVLPDFNVDLIGKVNDIFTARWESYGVVIKKAWEDVKEAAAGTPLPRTAAGDNQWGGGSRGEKYDLPAVWFTGGEDSDGVEYSGTRDEVIFAQASQLRRYQEGRDGGWYRDSRGSRILEVEKYEEGKDRKAAQLRKWEALAQLERRLEVEHGRLSFGDHRESKLYDDYTADNYRRLARAVKESADKYYKLKQVARATRERLDLLDIPGAAAAAAEAEKTRELEHLVRCEEREKFWEDAWAESRAESRKFHEAWETKHRLKNAAIRRKEDAERREKHKAQDANRAKEHRAFNLKVVAWEKARLEKEAEWEEHEVHIRKRKRDAADAADAAALAAAEAAADVATNAASAWGQGIEGYKRTSAVAEEARRAVRRAKRHRHFGDRS
jgi:hypothetical protein